MSALTYWLWLSGIRALGTAQCARILDDFGSPEAVYFADDVEFDRYSELSAETREALRDKSTERVEWVLERCEKQRIQVLTQQDALYPDRLKQMYDPPAVLYVKGKVSLLDEIPLLTVVGSRTHTPYGADVARRMCYQLTKAGMSIVSGMAKGIDAYAMYGTLKAGGFTVAVLGGGPDVVYPAQNQAIYDQICETGMILSEYPPGTEPAGAHFPVRNRIMAALGLGTLVIEAHLRSGALITARFAADLGRDVFCVPGSIITPDSAGCHELIKCGAALVTRPMDILREYIHLYPHKLTPVGDSTSNRSFAAGAPAGRVAGKTRETPAPEKETAHKTMPPEHLNDAQRLIFLTLCQAPKIVDEIVAATGLATPEVLKELTMLEIEGLIQSVPGKRFTIKQR